MTTRLTYPAPARAHTCARVWETTRTGKRRLVVVSSTHPWTLADVASAQSAGMYFVRGRHDFAERAAALAAGCAPRGETSAGTTAPSSLRRWIKQLTREQLDELVRVLDKGASA